MFHGFRCYSSWSLDPVAGPVHHGRECVMGGQSLFPSLYFWGWGEGEIEMGIEEERLYIFLMDMSSKTSFYFFPLDESFITLIVP